MWTDFSTEFFVGSFWEQAYNRNHLHLAAWNIFIYIFFKIMIYRSFENMIEMENSPYQCSGFPPWLLILMMPTVDWHRQLDVGHGFARANACLAGPTGPWRKEHNLNGCNLQTNSNETSAALETTVPKNTKENVPQTLRKMLIKMERDSQLVGARDYKQLASVVKRIRLSWLQVPPYIYSLWIWWKF